MLPLDMLLLETIDSDIGESWVYSCSQSVVVNGESFLPAPVTSWSLSLIYINDLTEINLRNGAKTTLYADNVLLFPVINS